MLTVAERETRFSMMGDDHGTWDVFTDDPMWIARLDKIAMAWKTSDAVSYTHLTLPTSDLV